MINIGIIGATGYAGVELLRIALRHPNIKIAALSSVSFEGRAISEVYPNLKDICDEILTDEDTVIEKSDVVFASLPHGLCEPLAKKCLEKNVLFIDLGADFRLSDEADYHEWYGLDYKEPELHKVSAYCIPELHRDALKTVKLSAIPDVILQASVWLWPRLSKMGSYVQTALLSTVNPVLPVPEEAFLKQRIIRIVTKLFRLIKLLHIDTRRRSNRRSRHLRAKNFLSPLYRICFRSTAALSQQFMRHCKRRQSLTVSFRCIRHFIKTNLLFVF